MGRPGLLAALHANVTEGGNMTNTARTDAGFAAIGGVPLYYEVAGTGRPLVLLHEGFADSRMFDDQIVALAAHYRVIRYDRHGCGRSGTPAVPYTHYEVLRELLRHLGIERASLLGLSMGGGVAIDATLACPDMVDALILVAASVGGYPSSEETMRQWGAIGAALAQGEAAEAVERTLRMWVDGPHRTPEAVDQAVRERMREMIAHYYTIRGDDPPPLKPSALARLDEIATPTLIVVGDGDVPDILAQAELLRKGIAGSRTVAIPEVAHVPNMERPALFNRLVLDFLGDARHMGVTGAG